MAAVREVMVPPDALLAACAGRGHVDAYAADLPRRVGLPDFIRAFYDSPAFRPERWILAAAGLRGSDGDLAALADGSGGRFAAWTLEARRPGEILLAAFRTRSWLAVAPRGEGCTLHFGSAVLARDDGRLGAGFGALLGFHRLYSRLLLAAAARRLARTAPARA
jgi:hypothetical protein